MKMIICYVWNGYSFYCIRGDIIREGWIKELDIRQPVKIMGLPAFGAFKYIK